jgi:hypothetical protein
MTWLKTSFPECIRRDLLAFARSIAGREAFLEFQIDNRHFIRKSKLSQSIIS